MVLEHLKLAGKVRMVLEVLGEHRASVEHPVLLQKHWEVSKDYAMFATPVGYLINQNGRVAKPVAVGGKAILGLVEPS